MIARIIRQAAPFLLLTAVACGDGTASPTGPGSTAAVQLTITLDADRDTLRFIGDTLRLRATVTNNSGEEIVNPTIVWRSLDGRVGVTAGLVRAIRQGTAEISASVGSSTARIQVVVDQVPAEVVVTGPSRVIAPREVADPPLVLVDSGGAPIPHLQDELTWSVADTAVADVDRQGRVLARSPGETTLTGSYATFAATADIAVGRISGRGEFRVWSADGTVLAGVYDTPSGPGPFPTMVRIHGSGRSTRNSGIFLRDQVRPVGVAVMRYDKRGVGESEGLYSGVGVTNSVRALTTLAEDAAAWLEFLSYNDAAEPDQLGVLGVSQGGWIAPLTASISPHVRYMINVVGPTITVGQQIYYQTVTGSTGAGQNNSGLSDNALYQMVRDYDGPSGFDPAPVLAELDIPGLWVLGTKDYLVPYAPTVEILESLVEATGADYSVLTLENGTHGTRDRTTQQFIPWWDTGDGGFAWLRARGFLD